MNIAAEKERILRRDSEWAQRASEGRDVELTLSYRMDDAVVLPRPPARRGQGALRQYVGGGMRIPGFRITWESKDVTFSRDGLFTYVFSRGEVTMDTPGGAPITAEGRAATIRRRESGGEWRCAVDIWDGESAT